MPLSAMECLVPVTVVRASGVEDIVVDLKVDKSSVDPHQCTLHKPLHTSLSSAVSSGVLTSASRGSTLFVRRPCHLRPPVWR